MGHYTGSTKPHNLIGAGLVVTTKPSSHNLVKCQSLHVWPSCALLTIQNHRYCFPPGIPLSNLPKKNPRIFVSLKDLQVMGVCLHCIKVTICNQLILPLFAV